MNAVIFCKNGDKLDIVILKECSKNLVSIFIRNFYIKNFNSKVIYNFSDLSISINVALDKCPRSIDIIFTVSVENNAANVTLKKSDTSKSNASLNAFENSIGGFNFKPQNVSLRKLGPETFSPSVKDLIKKLEKH